MLTSPLLTVHDAADILQVKESTVRVLIKDKRLRAVKIGKEWRIGQGDLLAFLNENANRDAEAPDPTDVTGSTPSEPEE